MGLATSSGPDQSKIASVASASVCLPSCVADYWFYYRSVEGVVGGGEISTNENVAYQLVPPNKLTLDRPALDQDDIYTQPESQQYVNVQHKTQPELGSPEDYISPIHTQRESINLQHIYD